MGRGIQLTEAEWDALDRLRFSTPAADVFHNCLIIRMSDSRQTIAGIAATVGCSAETVKRIRKLYRQGGLQALQPIKPPGRPSQATPAFLAAMKQAVLTSPLGLGYGFSTWSAARLARHLATTTGMAFRDDQLRRLLHQHGFSVHRPKPILKGKRDEAAYDQARRQLTRLKKKP